MTIQFRCPHCQALIRVAGSAAGKRGRCPQCAAKVEIPQQSQQSAQPDPAPEISPVNFESADEEQIHFAPAPEPVQTDPLFSTPNPGAGSGSPVPAFAPPDAPLHRRRQRKKSPPVVPLLFGSILIGVAIYFVVQSRPELTGTLAGKIVPGDEMDRGLIGRSEVSADAKTFERVRRDLEESPIKLLDGQGLYTITLAGVSAGIEVTAKLTSQGQCVRVDIGQNPELSDYVADHAGEFNAARTANLKRHAREFVDVWSKEIASGKRDAAALEKFRNHVAVASMVSGFGYHVAGSDGRRTYTCIAVKPGALLFVVPRGMKQFELRGVDVGDEIAFPGDYAITVSGSLQPPSEPEPASDAPDEAEPSETEPPNKK